jgi:alkyl hydroperoxide reductase subunit AhpF
VKRLSKLVLFLALVPLKTAIPKDRSFVMDGIAYTPVSYCELMGHPMEYDGKRIAICAGCVVGFEVQVMLSLKCRDLTYLAFMPETAKAERVLQKALRPGTSNATFYGTFHKEMLIKTFGIQGSYQFDVHYIKNIEFISKRVEATDNLSKKVQQKLCQGNEMPKAH